MIEYSDIRHVELELSSHCNARCPLCPRNLFGYTYNTGYTARNITLREVKSILPKNFLTQLDGITFEGNFGDPMMNPELLEIIKYLNRPIKIFTNASLQTKLFWQTLAKLNVEVYFALDGLSDTHSIYRQNTNFEKIITNLRRLRAASTCHHHCNSARQRLLFCRPRRDRIRVIFVQFSLLLFRENLVAVGADAPRLGLASPAISVR